MSPAMPSADVLAAEHGTSAVVTVEEQELNGCDDSIKPQHLGEPGPEVRCPNMAACLARLPSRQASPGQLLSAFACAACLGPAQTLCATHAALGCIPAHQSMADIIWSLVGSGGGCAVRLSEEEAEEEGSSRACCSCFGSRRCWRLSAPPHVLAPLLLVRHRAEVDICADVISSAPEQGPLVQQTGVSGEPGSVDSTAKPKKKKGLYLSFHNLCMSLSAAATCRPCSWLGFHTVQGRSLSKRRLPASLSSDSTLMGSSRRGSGSLTQTSERLVRVLCSAVQHYQMLLCPQITAFAHAVHVRRTQLAARHHATS